MSMKFYSANEVLCIVGAIPIESGKGDDTFIEIEQSEVRFTVKVGIDGQATMSESKSNVHKVTIYLMQSSDGNDVLSAIYKLAEKSAGGTLGVVPLVIKNKQGSSVFVAPEAFITGWPKEAFGKEAGTVQWEIIVPNPERFVGGTSGT